MPELTFQVESAEPRGAAAEPLLLFRLRVTGPPAVTIQSIHLRCQVRIEPARRRYTDAERQRLLDLFGTPERWGQTLRPVPWCQVSATVPPFTGSGAAELSVPCRSDLRLAATKYFAALEGGEIPLCFLFSGTIFYEAADGSVQMAPIPWDREATFRLPAATGRTLAAGEAVPT
jgi:hypothetical protein